MPHALTLYTLEDDIQCHRIRLLLAIKEVAYQREIVDLDNLPADLVELDPRAGIPALSTPKLLLSDTRVISQYLDERYPHPTMMPLEPSRRAALAMAVVRVECDWLPLIEQIETTSGTKQATACKYLAEQLLASIHLFAKNGYFLGSEMTLADCLVAPVVWRLPKLGVDLDKKYYPVLEYGQRIFRQPVFQASLTVREKDINS